MEKFVLDTINSYWFWAGLGFTLAYALCLYNMVKNNCPYIIAVIAATVGIYVGMISTRALWFLIFNPDLFLTNLPIIFAFWQETGTWLGSPVGFLGAYIVLKIVRQPGWSNVGSIVPSLALAHGIARIGCVVSGCCYGLPTTVPWAIYSHHLNAMVHPAQIYSSIGELISFIVLQLLWWKKPASRKYLYPLYCMMLASHRFITEFFRGDNPGPQIFPNLRIYQSICIFLFVFGLALFLILKWKKKGFFVAAIIVLLTVLAAIKLYPTAEPVLVSQRKDAKLYLVVTRDMFVDGLEKWKKQRQIDGFDVVIKGFSQSPSPKQIKDWITQQTKNSADDLASFIMIVADCSDKENAAAKWHVPSIKHSFDLNGNLRKFAADNLYGDIDGDGCPDVPVGRIAVRDNQQLQEQMAKILTYGQQSIEPDWFRMVLWIGARGYTTQMRHITEALAEVLPKWADRFIISADPDSAYSGVLPEQPEIFISQIERPACLSVIVSHGSYRSVTPTIHNGEPVFLSVEDVKKLKGKKIAGALFLVGCDSGKFNTSQKQGQSLAEAFVAHKTGPIAVIGASDSTNPLTNYFLTRSMITQIEKRPETIGDFLIAIQRQLFRDGKRSITQMAQADELAKELVHVIAENEKPKLLIQGWVQNEVLAYNLIGDPACKMKLPGKIALSALTSETGQMYVTCQTPQICSELTIEMIEIQRRKDVIMLDPSNTQRKKRFDKVNQHPKTLVKQKLSEKKWTTELLVPYEYFGNEDYIRFIAIGKDKGYIGLLGADGDKPFADRFIQQQQSK